MSLRRLSLGVKKNEINLQHLRKHLGLSENVAEYLILKHPHISKIDENSLKTLIRTVNELGYSNDILIDKPLLFGMLPITIKLRHQVLAECGFINITPDLVTSYLAVMKQKCIEDLKHSGLIPPILNVENKLASCMSPWPTSLTTSLWGDIDKLKLYALRLQIIQRYLELMLDLKDIEFSRGIETYPTLKHRPLAVINDTLTVLQSLIMLPPLKIKSNFYLLHADPNNLRNIIFKFRSIGGIDIKEVIRRHPKIAMKNYDTLVQIRKILKEYEINDEAQKRCFEIYTLGSATVRERLEKAKSIPEFKTFNNHPRFLKMIHNNNTAMKRLHKLYSSSKKCLSLNVLSGCSSHYEVFEKAPGDRLGKGNDLIFCIAQSLGKKYKKTDIRDVIRRHPFWLNIPLVQVKYVYEKLSQEFTPEEIFQNCSILLYPWNKVKLVLCELNENTKRNKLTHVHDFLDANRLSKSQKLSLVLYALEKDHYFTGNGVWNEEKIKTIVSC